MILYFDSYITDVPLNKHFVDPNRWVRTACPTYTMPSKLDIAKYSLASYAQYPWSHVLIRFELEDKSEEDSFEAYVRDLFPTATIIRTRSANQTEYRKSLTIMNEWDDDWIWYAPNNDHPITTHDLSVIDTAVAKAASFTHSYDYISVMYSHFSEFINIARRGTPFWRLFGQDTEIVDEDEHTLTYVQRNGDNTGIQIVNKKLFAYWFDSADLGDARIIRSEDIRKFFVTKNQLIVVPKREIASHFDGYSHTVNGVAEISADQVPPLFIPPGFFEHGIKIAYGFPTCQAGYTNVNPAASRYSFEDPMRGTDLKAALDELPVFWRDRITETKVNPDFVTDIETRGKKRQQAILQNPYALTNKRPGVQTLKYLLRSLRYRLQAHNHTSH